MAGAYRSPIRKAIFTTRYSRYRFSISSLANMSLILLNFTTQESISNQYPPSDHTLQGVCDFVSLLPSCSWFSIQNICYEELLSTLTSHQIPSLVWWRILHLMISIINANLSLFHFGCQPAEFGHNSLIHQYIWATHNWGWEWRHVYHHAWSLNCN